MLRSTLHTGIDPTCADSPQLSAQSYGALLLFHPNYALSSPLKSSSLRAVEIGVELGFSVTVVQGVESTATTSNTAYSVPLYNPPEDMIDGDGTWSTRSSIVSSFG